MTKMNKVYIIDEINKNTDRIVKEGEGGIEKKRGYVSLSNGSGDLSNGLFFEDRTPKTCAMAQSFQEVMKKINSMQHEQKDAENIAEAEKRIATLLSNARTIEIGRVNDSNLSTDSEERFSHLLVNIETVIRILEAISKK